MADLATLPFVSRTATAYGPLFPQRVANVAFVSRTASAPGPSTPTGTVTIHAPFVARRAVVVRGPRRLREPS